MRNISMLLLRSLGVTLSFTGDMTIRRFLLVRLEGLVVLFPPVGSIPCSSAITCTARIQQNSVKISVRLSCRNLATTFLRSTDSCKKPATLCTSQNLAPIWLPPQKRALEKAGPAQILLHSLRRV